MKMSLEDRVWSKVIPTGFCWLWSGSTGHGGYGIITLREQGRVQEWRAHRWVYERLVGPIAVGLVLDHLCRVRGCVNPDHLVPVTRGRNVALGFSRPAVVHRSGVCARGHALTPDNVYSVGVTNADGSPRVRCSTCKKAWERKRYASRLVRV